MEVNYSELLKEAVEVPGKVLEAYSAFHNYSLGNQFWALMQCYCRNIKPGPLATFRKWTEKGRFVRKGEKALRLIMPRMIKKTVNKRTTTGEEEKEVNVTIFVEKSLWFTLSQTEGAEFEMPTIPEWNRERALAKLEVNETTFTSLNGNAQGFAYQNNVAINPLAALPLKTLFHELGHVLLGHTKLDNETAKETKEAEAEAVALLCLAALNQPGIEYCRGYIQNWLGQGQEFNPKSALKVFSAADRILAAGKPECEKAVAA
jgi:antirestriction protein ArdC